MCSLLISPKKFSLILTVTDVLRADFGILPLAPGN